MPKIQKSLSAGRARPNVILCSVCGGIMRVIGNITEPDIIQKILAHIEAQLPPN